MRTQLSDEQVETLYRVSRSVAPKFRFGYLDVEDVVQEGVLFALQAIEDGLWDENRPLEPFLRTVIHNEMFNYKRDNFCRIEPPCLCCDIDTEEPCLKFRRWLQRNRAKMGLTQASTPEEGFDHPSKEGGGLVPSELLEKIDSVMPSNLRSDYLRMLDGVAVPKVSREKIREIVKGVINEQN